MLTIPHRDTGLWDTSDVDLRERLHGYEVTVVPAGQPTLTLVWSVADDEEGEAERGPTFGALALLDDYRITRVPGRVAS
jgi:hypothetical protein